MRAVGRYFALKKMERLVGQSSQTTEPRSRPEDEWLGFLG